MEKSIENLNGKSRVVATFEIPWTVKINPETKQEEVTYAKVKIKKLNFGEYNELQRASLKLTTIGTAVKADIDGVAMNEQAILKSVIEAPFPINDMNAIRDLDREVSEILLTNINELNTPTDKKKDN
jgi:hypothetical protein